MADDIDPDVFDGDVRVGDAFLLASDGLTGMVDDRRIQQLLVSRAKPERIVDALIQEANVNGGNDNITAVVVRVLAAESAGGDPALTVRSPQSPRPRAWVTIARLSRDSRSSTSATSFTRSSLQPLHSRIKAKRLMLRSIEALLASWPRPEVARRKVRECGPGFHQGDLETANIFSRRLVD
jgi:Serine/threonine protein phosphatase